MASKARLRRKSCEGKRRYSTMEGAREEASFVLSVSGKHLHPYRCHFCNEIHIGHLTGEARSAMRSRRGF